MAKTKELENFTYLGATPIYKQGNRVTYTSLYSCNECGAMVLEPKKHTIDNQFKDVLKRLERVELESSELRTYQEEVHPDIFFWREDKLREKLLAERDSLRKELKSLQKENTVSVKKKKR